jgi:hypothetical protein
LQKEKDKVLVQLRAALDSVVAHESEQEELWVKLQKEKYQLERGKEKLQVVALVGVVDVSP